MSKYRETNVGLPECAFTALAVVAGRRGISRDEVVRQLLDVHVAAQEDRTPEDRRTHISTVLRYPVPRQRWEKHEPRRDRPLRLRLAPGMVERARAVSLRLPGQYPRAYRDYQARLLTDAVMTAIAVEQPFTDDFLAGLWPLLRHGSAAGLWQLAVATTSTRPEGIIQAAAEQVRNPWMDLSGFLDDDADPDVLPVPEDPEDRDRLLLVAEALDEDVSWHSAFRFEVAANIARDLLRGDNARDNEQMLYEQRGRWHELVLDLRFGKDEGNRAPYLAGTSGHNPAGRGGAAVWRAERRVELQDFEEWLVDAAELAPVERRLKPPCWLIRLPGGWRAHAAVEVVEPFASWVAEGRLLAFPVGHKFAVWPLKPAPGGTGWQPVPGIEPLALAARTLEPQQISGFIEAMLVDWDSDCDLVSFPLELRLPADQAYAFGLIEADARGQALLDARAATVEAMDRIIAETEQDHIRSQLEAVRGNTRMFKRVLARLLPRVVFKAVPGTWSWPGGTVAEEVVAGRRADIVQWLATWAYRAHDRHLQGAMQEAWTRAFDHLPASAWLPTTSCDTDHYYQP